MHATGYQLSTTATRGRDPRLPDPHAARYESVLGVQRNLTRLLSSSSVASVVVEPEAEAQVGEAAPRASSGDGSVVITWRRRVSAGVDTTSYESSVEMVPAELALTLTDPSTISVEVGIPARLGVLGQSPVLAGAVPASPVAAPTAPAAGESGESSAGAGEVVEGELVGEQASAAEGSGDGAGRAEVRRAELEAAAAARLAQLRASIHPPS